jgi:hypothetical protein
MRSAQTCTAPSLQQGRLTFPKVTCPTQACRLFWCKQVEPLRSETPPHTHINQAARPLVSGPEPLPTRHIHPSGAECKASATFRTLHHSSFGPLIPRNVTPLQCLVPAVRGGIFGYPATKPEPQPPPCVGAALPSTVLALKPLLRPCTHNHVRHEPITTPPTTQGWRLWRWVRRHAC